MKRMLSILVGLAMVFCMSSPAFAAISRPSEARTVLEYVNDERVAAGLEPLVWESSLVNFAEVRANEIITKWSHTRPNGKKATDQEGVNGENLAYGTDYSAGEVVDGWMGSPSHRDNILTPEFTSMAAACVEETKVVPGYGEVPFFYWVQLFRADKKAAASRTSATPEKTVAVSGAVTSKAALASLKASGTTATATNKSTASPSVFRDLAKANPNAVLVAKTTFSSGKTTQGQLAIRAADFAQMGEDVKLGVFVESDQTLPVLNKFRKWYRNPNLAAIQLDHAGAFPAPVKVAAKVDLRDFDAKALVFYCYDKAANKVTRIENPQYRVDKNGFLHLSVSRGGSILISDQPLTK